MQNQKYLIVVNL